MGLKEAVKQLWVKKIEKEYEKLLSQKKISYREWVEDKEREAVSRCVKTVDAHESRDSAAVPDDPGEYVLLQQKAGHLSEHAKLWISAYFAEHPEVQILYGDEDFLNEQGIRENPWYKPCWSPDTYLSQFYVGSVIAVKKSLLEKNYLFSTPQEIRPILTPCIKLAGGFEKGCRTIARCPQVLFHVTDRKVWEKYLASAETVLNGKEGVETEKVSVIIPSKDNPEVLGKCLESLRKTSGPEIIVVDNGSSPENKRKIEELTRGMKYIYEPMEFNFSRMCNIGADAAGGKYLLFLNDDIEVCGEDWLYAMKAKARLPYVGAVGLKLYYPDSNRIQHAGITNLPVGPVHKMQFTLDEGSIYFDRNRADMNCLAVTGACLLIDKEKYMEVGGLKESLRVAYNDVDLGFALYEAGYQNVVINTHYAYHHESLSRGSDETREKQARLQKEREHLYEMHPALKGKDPYFPSELSIDGPDVRIVPGYYNARNTVQKASMEAARFDSAQIRVDNCLLLGIEQSEKSMIRGYAVVLGDNNACYDRFVVLAEEEELTGSGNRSMCPENVWLISTEPQYRQDLEENIPDQVGAPMCGFHVSLSEAEQSKLVPGREYRVGVLAVHKINKGKILNWSARCLR